MRSELAVDLHDDISARGAVLRRGPGTCPKGVTVYCFGSTGRGGRQKDYCSHRARELTDVPLVQGSNRADETQNTSRPRDRMQMRRTVADSGGPPQTSTGMSGADRLNAGERRLFAGEMFHGVGAGVLGQAPCRPEAPGGPLRPSLGTVGGTGDDNGFRQELEINEKDKRWAVEVTQNGYKLDWPNHRGALMAGSRSYWCSNRQTRPAATNIEDWALAVNQ